MDLIKIICKIEVIIYWLSFFIYPYLIISAIWESNISLSCIKIFGTALILHITFGFITIFCTDKLKKNNFLYISYFFV